jgi:uncharacterized protein (UPF0261 family)
LGTLDTKAEEVAYLKAEVEALGYKTLVVDIGFGGTPSLEADLDRQAVAAAAGSSLDAISSRLRSEGVGAEEWASRLMAEGAAKLLRELHERGLVAGVVGIGGTMGSFMASEAMRALPFGVPKLLVTTQASSPRAPLYVGSEDITIMNAVSDLIGLNWMTKTVLASAARAIVGMASKAPPRPERPLIGATGLGTTPCIMKAGELLNKMGYELIPFHATGSGGRAFEALIRRGLFKGVLDLALHEVANEVFGGCHVAGPGRLMSAGTMGIPQVVAPGALCIICYTTLEEVPPQYRSRTWRHNPYTYVVDLARDELAKLGEVVAERLNLAKGPTKVLVPLRGWYGPGLTAPEKPKHEDCEAFLKSLRRRLRPEVEVEAVDAHINDLKFAEHAVSSLLELMRSSGHEPWPQAAR